MSDVTSKKAFIVIVLNTDPFFEFLNSSDISMYQLPDNGQ